MKSKRIHGSKSMGVFFNLSIIAIAALLGACSQNGTSVIATTGTTIGVEISQNQATQTPTAVLGYRRAELAYVPTNRGHAKKTKTSKDSNGNPVTIEQDGFPTTGSGARDSANVIMELKYNGIFETGTDSGIYQRLAVGDIAVTQSSAMLMFSKNPDGTVDKNVAKYVAAAQQELAVEESRIGKIVSYVSTGSDAVDNVTLIKLVSDAKAKAPKIIQGGVESAILSSKKGSELKEKLSDDLDTAIEPLFKALPSDKQ